MPRKSEDRVLNIHEFAIDEMKPNSKLAIIGKPGTGKSTLITAIAYYYKHIFPVASIYSGTEDTTHYFKQFFPTSFVYNDLDRNRIQDFIARQKLSKKEQVEVPWAMLILDDCTDDPKVLKETLFQSIFKKGRHWKMMFILSLQYSMDIMPVIRTSVDYAFILRESSQRNRKILFENYASAIPSFSDFNDIMDQLTDDYTAVVINNRTQSNNLEDCVFYYKADIKKLDGFKFGCREYRQWDRDRYDPKYSEPIN